MFSGVIKPVVVIKRVKMMCRLQSKSSVYTHRTLRRGDYSPSDPVRTNSLHFKLLVTDMNVFRYILVLDISGCLTTTVHFCSMMTNAGLSLALCQCSTRCRVAWCGGSSSCRVLGRRSGWRAGPGVGRRSQSLSQLLTCSCRQWRHGRR